MRSVLYPNRFSDSEGPCKRFMGISPGFRPKAWELGIDEGLGFAGFNMGFGIWGFREQGLRRGRLSSSWAPRPEPYLEDHGT